MEPTQQHANTTKKQQTTCATVCRPATDEVVTNTVSESIQAMHTSRIPPHHRKLSQPRHRLTFNLRTYTHTVHANIYKYIHTYTLPAGFVAIIMCRLTLDHRNPRPGAVCTCWQLIFLHALSLLCPLTLLIALYIQCLTWHHTWFHGTECGCTHRRTGSVLRTRPTGRE